jgi:hypothetical protein
MTHQVTHKKIRSAVRRDFAESNLLSSLVAFAVTVITTRLFLELTGYPQLGNNVLHFAHALWGGLLLIIAVILPIAFANRWALRATSVLGGVGIGLFIDEVGKFITQANDYFFPPALSLIYSFFLLLVFVYLHFRRPHEADPRKALYHVFEGLLDALDDDLDKSEAARIEAQLAVARKSNRPALVGLAEAIDTYLQQEQEHLASAEPGFWKRTRARITAFAQGLGQIVHRRTISALLIVWGISAGVSIVLLLLKGSSLDSQTLQWRFVILLLQSVTGGLLITALFTWLAGKEVRGIQLAESGLLLSLVALQTINFFLSQYSALGATLLQVAFLMVLQAYRRWYLPTD